MERVYHTMKKTGVGSIAIGIIVLTTGIVLGIIAIVNGSLLLKRKDDIEF